MLDCQNVRIAKDKYTYFYHALVAHGGYVTAEPEPTECGNFLRVSYRIPYDAVLSVDTAYYSRQKGKSIVARFVDWCDHILGG